MDETARVAYINAQTVCALCELAGMQAANQEADLRRIPRPWKSTDLMAIPDRFGLGHNAVVGYLTGR